MRTYLSILFLLALALCSAAVVGNYGADQAAYLADLAEGAQR